MHKSIMVDCAWGGPYTLFWRWFAVYAQVDQDFGQEVAYHLNKLSEDDFKAASPAQRKVYVACAMVQGMYDFAVM